MAGLRGNKIPSFKTGRCRGCIDCDAGKRSGMWMKAYEERLWRADAVADLEMRDEEAREAPHAHAAYGSAARDHQV